MSLPRIHPSPEGTFGPSVRRRVRSYTPLEQFEETAVHARRGIALARAAGRDDSFPTLFPCLGNATWVLGRLAESAEVRDAAVEAARLTGNVQEVAWSLLSRAISALMAGDWDLARRAAQESMDLAVGSTTGSSPPTPASSSAGSSARPATRRRAPT